MFNIKPDYEQVSGILSDFKSKYDFIEIFPIGKSFMQREIYCAKIGAGPKKIIYVGGHHALEWGCIQILLQFFSDYCSAFSQKKTLYGYKSTLAYNNCTLYIVFCLNPDGTELHLNGISPDNPLYHRILSMNNNSECFDCWQANARGVDLNHNYNAQWSKGKLLEQKNNIFFGCATRYGGEFPESESESASLCALTREKKPDCVIAFHSQGEEIYYDFNGYVPKNAYELAKIIKKMTGYELSTPEPLASFGGYKDWFIEEFDKPGFTIECGLGKNPLTAQQAKDAFSRLKEMMIFLPIFI